MKCREDSASDERGLLAVPDRLQALLEDHGLERELLAECPKEKVGESQSQVLWCAERPVIRCKNDDQASEQDHEDSDDEGAPRRGNESAPVETPSTVNLELPGCGQEQDEEYGDGPPERTGIQERRDKPDLDEDDQGNSPREKHKGCDRSEDYTKR